MVTSASKLTFPYGIFFASSSIKNQNFFCVSVFRYIVIHIIYNNYYYYNYYYCDWYFISSLVAME